MNLSQVANIVGFGSNKKDETPKEISLPVGERVVLLTWDAPARTQSKDVSQKLTRTFLVIGVVLALLLVILREYFLIVVIVSLFFVNYVLTKTPPENTTYTVSTHGISIGDQMYYWAEFKHFFFTEREGHPIVGIDRAQGVPSRLYLTFLEKDRDELKRILAERLHFLEQEPKTVLDNTFASIVDKFNI